MSCHACLYRIFFVDDDLITECLCRVCVCADAKRKCSSERHVRWKYVRIATAFMFPNHWSWFCYSLALSHAAENSSNSWAYFRFFSNEYLMCTRVAQNNLAIIHCESKRMPLYCCPYLRQMLTSFQTFYTTRRSNTPLAIKTCHFIFQYNTRYFLVDFTLSMFQWKQEWILYRTAIKFATSTYLCLQLWQCYLICSSRQLWPTASCSAFDRNGCAQL